MGDVVAGLGAAKLGDPQIWAQRLDQRLIKGFVFALGAGLTVYFLWRGV